MESPALDLDTFIVHKRDQTAESRSALDQPGQRQSARPGDLRAGSAQVLFAAHGKDSLSRGIRPQQASCSPVIHSEGYNDGKNTAIGANATAFATRKLN
jgi:hypothetical protein